VEQGEVERGEGNGVFIAAALLIFAMILASLLESAGSRKDIGVSATYFFFFANIFLMKNERVFLDK